LGRLRYLFFTAPPIPAVLQPLRRHLRMRHFLLLRELRNQINQSLIHPAVLGSEPGIQVSEVSFLV
jgi:hypothetical protein